MTVSKLIGINMYVDACIRKTVLFFVSPDIQSVIAINLFHQIYFKYCITKKFFMVFLWVF